VSIVEEIIRISFCFQVWELVYDSFVGVGILGWMEDVLNVVSDLNWNLNFSHVEFALNIFLATNIIGFLNHPFVLAILKNNFNYCLN
jgi:hypothetical protein